MKDWQYNGESYPVKCECSEEWAINGEAGTAKQLCSDEEGVEVPADYNVDIRCPVCNMYPWITVPKENLK